MELTKGANAPLDKSKLRLVLRWSGNVDVDAAALLCDASGRVRNDEDFIFYNQPQHISNSVAHAGKVNGAVSTDSLRIDLDRAESAIDKIVITGATDGGTFGDVTSLSLDVVCEDAGNPLIQYPITGVTTETALIAGELYRRNGVWKFRAIGQGYASGLRGVATDYGITVDDPPEVPVVNALPPQPVSPPPNAAPHQPPQQFAPQPPPNAGPPPQWAPSPTPPPAGQYGPLPGGQYGPPSGVPAQQPAPGPTGPGPQQPNGADYDPEAPEEEVTLQPFPTKNPYLKKIFGMKEFGRAPGRAIEVFRERVVDPEEKMIAAFKSKHGQYKWGYLVLTDQALRWFQTMPVKDETVWGWDDVGLNGSVVVCEGWQYQLKGFGAGRKFKALMLVLLQAEGWAEAHQ